MPGLASEVAKRVLEQKLSYAYKVLSSDSTEVNMYTFYDMFDAISFSFDFTITDTLFSSLVSSVIFGIPLSDVVPVSMDFEVMLPTPEEFARGTHIKLVYKDITERYPELLSISTTFFGVFEPEVAQTLLGQQLEKGVYGRSRYGQSYYDPQAFREFIRSSLFALTKKRSTDESVRARLEAIAKSLGINMDLVEYIFNLLQMTFYSKVTSCSLDFCWMDVSCFPVEGSEASVRFVDWSLQPVDAEYLGVFDFFGSCWFDNCLMDVSLFSPDEPPTIYVPEIMGNLLSEVSYYMYNKVRSRLLVSPLALSNYQTYDEMENPRESMRMEQFGISRGLIESVRAWVNRSFRDAVPNPYTLNLYADAAVDLVKRLSKPGGWGDEAFRAMSREELLSYFLDRWGSQGLDRGILEKIFIYVYDTGIYKVYTSRRSSERESVKVARGGL